MAFLKGFMRRSGAAENTWLVVGLGNPGSQYARTRHNCGFRVISLLMEHYGVRSCKTKGRAQIAEVREGSMKVVLAMPQTYMNLSGESVRELLRIYGLQPDRLLVIYDDIDIPAGTLRLRAQGSAGTHNGMRSIIGCIGSNGFARLRVGVGKPPPEYDLADYVLAAFPPEQKADMEAAFTRAADYVRAIITDGVEKTMSSQVK